VATHIIFARPLDGAEIRAGADRDERPRHLALDLVDAARARLWAPQDVPPSGLIGRLVDRVGGLIVGSPADFAVARHVARHAKRGDTILSYDNAAFGLLVVGCWRRRRFRLLIDLVSPSRPRSKMMLRFRPLSRRIDRILVNSSAKAADLLEMGLPQRVVGLLPDATDADFFRPADGEADVTPYVASAGREQRDFVTLASALEGTDLSVRVCATSANPTKHQQFRVPDPIPANFEIRHFDWPEFRELYQHADVVVVPTLRNEYAAGLTVILEAFACGKAVVATDTIGPIRNLARLGLLVGVPPEDPAALKTAIESLRSDPRRRNEMGILARRWVTTNASAEGYLEFMLAELAGEYHSLDPVAAAEVSQPALS
jgi:glycosyltransferase involved in cell wall biosynthesis